MIRLLQNNSLVPESAVAVLTDVGVVTGVAIISAAAGDTVAIGTALRAITLAAGTNAFLDIVRIV